MDKSKLNEWLQLGASIGVILSLIFVGLEIQQSRQIAVADIYQQRSAMLIDLHIARLSSEPLTAANLKQERQEELSSWELNVVTTAHLLLLTYWENNHFQFQQGLLSEEQWNASRRAIGNYHRNVPGALEYWKVAKTGMRDSFIIAVDDAIAKTE